MGGAIAKDASAIISLKECTLWKSDRSPSCRSVMMALDALNLSVNEIDVDMEKNEHKSLPIASLNNRRTLPILKDKDMILWDSHSINSYLATRYSNDGRLLPHEPARRSKVEQLMYFNSGVLYPRYQAAAYPILHDDCKHVLPQQVNDIESAYAELEFMLLGKTWFSNCPWPMLSDICICATVSTMNVMVPIDKVRFPKLSSWLHRMSEEVFYLTANQKGLGEFSRRIDRSQVYVEDLKRFTCPRTSVMRRITHVPPSPAGQSVCDDAKC